MKLGQILPLIQNKDEQLKAIVAWLQTVLRFNTVRKILKNCSRFSLACRDQSLKLFIKTGYQIQFQYIPIEMWQTLI